MSEEMIDLLRESLAAKENVDKVIKTETTSVGTLTELQKAATAVQKKSKDEEWEAISSYNFAENTPYSMAKLISQMPWGPSGSYLPMAQSMALALHWYATGLNPFFGEIFILPSGKIGTSLQGMLKGAKREGFTLSAPKYTDVTRPWPKGLILSRREGRNDVQFTLPEDIGVKCAMTINEQPVEFTTWFTEWFMPGNPNWYTRASWMLRVQAQKRCLAIGTGIAVSEEIADDGAGPKESGIEKSREVKAPGSTPFGGGK